MIGCRALVAMACCALAACTAAQPNKPETALFPVTYTHFRDLTSAEKKIIMAGVVERFRDPTSAQFRWTKITNSIATEPKVYYCGMVNAKNAYGGYVGFGPFWSWVHASGGKITHAELIGSGSDDLAMRVIGRECAERGIDIRTAA